MVPKQVSWAVWLQTGIARLLIAVSCGVTVYAFACVLVKPHKEWRESTRIMYAREGDRIWGEFRVQGLLPYKDGAGNEYVDVLLKPNTDTFTEPSLYFRVPRQGEKIVQWQRKFRFKIRPVQEGVVELDRQNVEQFVSY